MFVYLLRFILIFWIISIIIRWIERFIAPTRTNGPNPEPQRPVSETARSVNEPPDLDITGTIVDADFVELDGEE